ncbi:D-alanyl-D-alanine carboxypeptidase/D-alanyl-D-alanine endopeptidase [Inhella gelatinilytica]|uniref:D-alanyl-D-alanine carboxypeptidase/D-alanyl-D-alanine-endopeptidase n=1 Tax=Inhella gelatinilytica TaxID=2795030 RepID=A0A931ND49_9BURK|nr:D-alanyl-D-alanine carboxypeptidase/D-alanyl-D-alanine-endopeptidase [Inhella gelatinilytica]MBH9552229.1 D-alanyl-D-alanine carboxypeptidase/D-alanyl-D-alanine-endopeptidase [Inhella gelatinilytica]
MRAAFLLLALAGSLTLSPPAGAADRAALPAAVRQALKEAQLPPEALSVWIAPADGGRVRWAWNETVARNPASLTKLATTFAALEQLGPAWRWKTPVWLNGKLDAATGVLQGDVLIQGRGDPSLNLERLWLLVRRLQALGVREIQGDVLLDSSAFAPDPQSPADFDGEPWRAGNVRPDALLFNLKAHSLTLRPDPAAGVVRGTWDTPAWPAPEPAPLRAGPCTDARGALKANWVHRIHGVDEAPGPLRFTGAYPASCGEQVWPLADPEPAQANARLFDALWRQSGGKLTGWVRNAAAGAELTARAPALEHASPPLGEVVRDINKFSNNLMAEQLWLTLALQSGAATPISAQQAREHLHTWLRQRLEWDAPGWQLENGSGLARGSRLSAQQIGQLLQAAWASPVMPEFVASLPLAGEDGTLRRNPERFGPVRARAHLKTGSLRDVVAVAGYMHGKNGQRWVVVALIQHDRAQSGRGVLDAVLRGLG